jgi:hypothetical protein
MAVNSTNTATFPVNLTAGDTVTLHFNYVRSPAASVVTNSQRYSYRTNGKRANYNGVQRGKSNIAMVHIPYSRYGIWHDATPPGLTSANLRREAANGSFSYSNVLNTLDSSGKTISNPLSGATLIEGDIPTSGVKALFGWCATFDQATGGSSNIQGRIKDGGTVRAYFDTSVTGVANDTTSPVGELIVNGHCVFPAAGFSNASFTAAIVEFAAGVTASQTNSALNFPGVDTYFWAMEIDDATNRLNYNPDVNTGLLPLSSDNSTRLTYSHDLDVGNFYSSGLSICTITGVMSAPGSSNDVAMQAGLLLRAGVPDHTSGSGNVPADDFDVSVLVSPLTYYGGNTQRLSLTRYKGISATWLLEDVPSGYAAEFGHEYVSRAGEHPTRNETASIFTPSIFRVSIYRDRQTPLGDHIDVSGVTNNVLPDPSVTSKAYVDVSGLANNGLPDPFVDSEAYVDATGLANNALPDPSVTSKAYVDVSGLANNGLPDPSVYGDQLVDVSGLSNNALPDPSVDSKAYVDAIGLANNALPDPVVYGDQYVDVSGLANNDLPDPVVYAREDQYVGATGLASNALPDPSVTSEAHVSPTGAGQSVVESPSVKGRSVTYPLSVQPTSVVEQPVATPGPANVICVGFGGQPVPSPTVVYDVEVVVTAIEPEGFGVAVVADIPAQYIGTTGIVVVQSMGSPVIGYHQNLDVPSLPYEDPVAHGPVSYIGIVPPSRYFGTDRISSMYVGARPAVALYRGRRKIYDL